MGESGLGAGAKSNLRAAKIRSEKIRADQRSKLFRVVAKHAFPRKTAEHLREFVNVPERTCYDWLSGTSQAPHGVMLALLGEIARRELIAG